jgi:primosomal protein N' (replication factor Y)
MYMQVIVNRPTYRRPSAGSDPLPDDASRLVSYTYRLPERLQETVLVGHLIQVPLGASTTIGIVAALTDSAPRDLPAGVEIRDVIELLDLLPVVTPTQINLTHWIADQYLAPLSEAIRLMLPPGLEERTYIVVSRVAQPPAPTGLTAQENAVLQLLHQHGGRLPLARLLSAIGGEDPEAVTETLADRGLIEAHYTLVPPKPAPPRIQYVRLLADDPTIESVLPRLGHPSKQADLLLALARSVDAPLTRSELCELADCTDSPVQALAERGWIEMTERRTLVTAVPGAESFDLGRAKKQAAALSALISHTAPVEIEEFLAETGISSATEAALEKKGLIQRISEEPVVLLKLPADQVLERVIELRGAEKQQAILESLRGSPGRVWVGGLYAQIGASLSDLRKLAEMGLISLHTEEYDLPSPIGTETPPQLTPDQAAIWAEVEQGMMHSTQEAPFIALVHGVTGSGKTEIYLRAVQAVLDRGRRAIILVPEISLTAQTVRRFESRFPGRIAVMHSQLPPGQRYAVWDRVRRGEADLVIGARSALFAPISRLGLIVLDEAHDDSYKQDEPIPLPGYVARDTAIALAHLTGAAVLLGSATPDLVTYYRASTGTYRLLNLPRRILPHLISEAGQAPGRGQLEASPLPPVRVVDLRQELRTGNRSIFSRALQQALYRTLTAHEQALLFLNRRGLATFVLCRDCGYVAKCPKCDVPLTFHRPSPSGRLVCHRCNYHAAPPSFCPQCGGRQIRYFGLGTERVEATLREFFPEARLLRWDRDTASGLDHERYLQAFVDHRADVLIGTQMIAKGLDLPLVTLVGVISADTALYLPDYRAAERTFQLLTQVAGRAGRSRRGGQVIVQTYNPDHYAIQAAARHDYLGFYQQELSYRRQLGYPPLSRLVALRFSHQDAHRCRAEAERLARWLRAEIRQSGQRADLIGPAPCFVSRMDGRYRWQIVIRGANPSSVLRDVALPWGWRVDVDPVSLL